MVAGTKIALTTPPLRRPAEPARSRTHSSLSDDGSWPKEVKIQSQTPSPYAPTATARVTVLNHKADKDKIKKRAADHAADLMAAVRRRAITDYSIKEKRDAWQRAKIAADAVEATALGKKETDTPGGATRQERLLLDRLRSEQYVEQVGEAWLRIERHFKKGDEGRRVIKFVLNSFTRSNNATLIPVDYRLSLERLKELKGCADQLHGYFTDEIERDPTWKILAGITLSVERSLKDMVASLEHIRLFLTGRVQEFSDIFDQIGLTREVKSPAAAHVVFSAAMSDAMNSIFGKWLDEVVAAFTEVAFETEVTIDQIKHARRATARRRVRTEAPKD